LRRDGKAHGQITPLDETGEASLHRAAFDHHVAVTSLAPQPDVRPEAVDEPLRAAAGVRSPEDDDVAEAELDDWGLIGTH
jgi:hypothetical protein